jgi:flagellin-specific chaperone FliS
MDSNANYVRTQILTASPAQLRALLLQQAVQSAVRLQEALGSGSREHTNTQGQTLRKLVLELLASLSEQADPALLKRMRTTLAFLYRRIGDACAHLDSGAAAEVAGLLAYEEETWRQVMARSQTRTDGHDELRMGSEPGRINLAG